MFAIQKKNREDAEMPLLILEAEIKRLGFDYLLQELPTDQKSILEIANIFLLGRKITCGTDMENLAQLENYLLTGIYSFTCSLTFRFI